MENVSENDSKWRDGIGNTNTLKKTIKVSVKNAYCDEAEISSAEIDMFIAVLE